MKTVKLTILLAGLAMIGPFATDTFLPSFPAIAQYFEVSYLLVQQTLSAYLFGFSLMTLFYGTLSDSFGRRPVIIVSLVVFTIASIGASMAPSFSLLLLFRALQGASAGAGRVVGQAIVRDRFNSADAQRMISNIAMVFGIAPAIAPVVGGFLHVTFGWRSNFVLMALIGAILVAACLRALPETLPQQARHPFRPGLILGNFRTAIRHGRFVLCCLATGFSFGGFALYISSAAHFVMEILHLPETAFAWLFVPMIGGTVIGSAVGSRLAHRVRPAAMIRIGFIIMAIAVVLNMAYTYAFVAAVPWAVLPIMLYSFGLSLAIPGMTIATLDIFPTMRGLASSLQSFVQMLIFALVSGFVAPLLFDSAFKLAAGVAAAVVLSLSFWLLGNLRGRKTDGRD